MVISWLFRRSEPRPEQQLYEAILAASRAPGFYGAGGIPDTVDGRFEILALHMVLANRRLRELDKAFAQALFDRFKSDMEANLRELGTGDARFSKRMKHIVRSLYGRMQAFEGPLAERDEQVLAETIGRNAPEGMNATYTESLAGYALAAQASLEGEIMEDFLHGRLTLPEPPSISRG